MPVVTYTGDGSAFHAGIPARDLEQEDVDALTDEQRAVLADSPLYELVGETPPAEPAPETAPEPPAEGANT